MDDCIFCKIINKKISAEIEYENDRLIAFKDINAQAPVHMLIIPKIHISTLNDLLPEHTNLMGELIQVSKDIAKLKTYPVTLEQKKEDFKFYYY